VNAANAGALAYTLTAERARALLFRPLATLRTATAHFDDVDELSADRVIGSLGELVIE